MNKGLVLDGRDKIVDRVAEAQVLKAVPSYRQQTFESEAAILQQKEGQELCGQHGKYAEPS